MSERIDLAALREAATFDSVAQGAATMIVRQDVLLALAEAVEAAHKALPNSPRSDTQRESRLRAKLEAFDFGPRP